ncbi:unnamed protein product [Polarella glacialis]|uniref:Uncharacterized protein n=1 Tax=Polarella glacialis TaxID=89957 RepID=A0A813LE00_POLGL|nr:unnamed protein product [Polarella glacialis]
MKPLGYATNAQRGRLLLTHGRRLMRFAISARLIACLFVHRAMVVVAVVVVIIVVVEGERAVHQKIQGWRAYLKVAKASAEYLHTCPCSCQLHPGHSFCST